MALAVPTQLENEADSASRRLNSLGLTRNKARRTSHGRTLRSRLLGPPLCHFTGEGRLHLTEHPNALPSSQRCSGQPRETLLRCLGGSPARTRYGMRLEPCDAGETGAIRSTWQSDLDPTRRSGKGVTDREALCHHCQDFRNTGGQVADRGGNRSEFRDKIPPIPHAFHTNRPSRTALRASPGQPHNAPMPMKSKKRAAPADLPADPPSSGATC